MRQIERLNFLIAKLLGEQPRHLRWNVPSDIAGKKLLLRSLFNVRMPMPVDDEFLNIQNEYLQKEINDKGITDINDLKPFRDNLYLWQGDITTLKVNAVVNAANKQMLGCFVPGHFCIDNAIHSYAGVQLRILCDEIMKKQGKPEETGTAKITPSFNLPSDYVLHTVGPIINGELTKKDCDQLASCYCSCLELAEKNQIKSIAFCCISTGAFHFPNEKAAEIAVGTVREYIDKKQSKIKVIFNIYKKSDYEIYRKMLKEY